MVLSSSLILSVGDRSNDSPRVATPLSSSAPISPFQRRRSSDRSNNAPHILPLKNATAAAPSNSGDERRMASRSGSTGREDQSPNTPAAYSPQQQNLRRAGVSFALPPPPLSSNTDTKAAALVSSANIDCPVYLFGLPRSSTVTSSLSSSSSSLFVGGIKALESSFSGTGNDDSTDNNIRTTPSTGTDATSTPTGSSAPMRTRVSCLSAAAIRAQQYQDFRLPTESSTSSVSSLMISPTTSPERKKQLQSPTLVASPLKSAVVLLRQPPSSPLTPRHHRASRRDATNNIDPSKIKETTVTEISPRRANHPAGSSIPMVSPLRSGKKNILSSRLHRRRGSVGPMQIKTEGSTTTNTLRSQRPIRSGSVGPGVEHTKVGQNPTDPSHSSRQRRSQQQNRFHRSCSDFEQISSATLVPDTPSSTPEPKTKLLFLIMDDKVSQRPTQYSRRELSKKMNRSSSVPSCLGLHAKVAAVSTANTELSKPVRVRRRTGLTYQESSGPKAAMTTNDPATTTDSSAERSPVENAPQSSDVPIAVAFSGGSFSPGSCKTSDVVSQISRPRQHKLNRMTCGDNEKEDAAKSNHKSAQNNHQQHPSSRSPSMPQRRRHRFIRARSIGNTLGKELNVADTKCTIDNHKSMSSTTSSLIKW